MTDTSTLRLQPRPSDLSGDVDQEMIRPRIGNISTPQYVFNGTSLSRVKGTSFEDIRKGGFIPRDSQRRHRVKTGRAILGLYNLIFWISGAAIFSYGVAELLNTQHRELSHILQVELVPYQPPIPLLYWLYIGLLLSGGLVFVVGFLGCWASLEENCKAASLYIALLITACTGEITMATLAILGRNLLFFGGLETFLLGHLHNSYSMPQSETLTRGIDLMQTKFSCCGVRGESDYFSSRWRQETGVRGHRLTLPLTCCVLSNSKTEDSYLDPSPQSPEECQDINSRLVQGRHSSPCLPRLLQWGSKQYLTIAGIGVGTAILHSIGIILTCSLLQKMNRGRKK